MPSFDEALSRLLFLVEHRRPCGVVLGLGGTGKSALMEAVRQELIVDTCRTIPIDLRTTLTNSVPWSLAAGMGLAPAFHSATESLWMSIEDRAEGAASAGISYAPLFDHIEQADPDTLAIVERCCHLFARTQGTVLLCGRPPLPLELSSLVRSLCDLRIELPPWNATETAYFILQRQEEDASVQYTESAVAAIHEHSKGRLRDVQQLCRLAIFAAEAQEIETIDGEFIGSIAGEIWRPVTQPHDIPALASTSLELASFSQ